MWVSTDGAHFRDGLLLAWRRQLLPSVGDQHEHWFGQVLTARTFGQDVRFETRWVWVPYILPVPSDAAVREIARARLRVKRSAR